VAGQERLAAWKRAMQDAGLAAEDHLSAVGWFTAPGGADAMAKLLKASGGRPTAVVCANDRMALGALRHAREIGLRVPADLSIIGFDNIDAAELAHPGLTTVAVPRDALVAAAFDALVAALEGEESPATSTVRLPTSLVVRESTGRASS
jgi:DNA-binding LacI/PurR family transcriptional regulator